ncbi:low molecular weight phosphotyrosine protein phosphatase [Dictyocaulus viviparus]|uniref:Low molecular weight phosphotyrosine protein phosphatase n=1 Tax=Dictyocaulus viviparus TaxID=29172 RepID=A0A0D8XQX0_DICVI|nr:low molecular weight phosphotyrosine protein phosphatase [Dictyocaulus viviparus]
MTTKKSVLFVCLGNICRSPIAEAVFLDIIKKRGVYDQWTVDSAAIIAFHSGKPPDRRALSTLRKFGILDYEHRARVVTTNDICDFNYIFGMDDSNMDDLRELEKQTRGKAVIQLLGSYDPQGHRIVPDPYYESGDKMFEQVYHQCVRCCEAFLNSLE